MMPLDAMREHAPVFRPRQRLVTALLLCGVVSSLLYVGIDLLGGLSSEGYSFSGQAISELTAIGAPTRSLLWPLYLGYGILLIAFGLGVWAAADEKAALRLGGLLLAAVGLLGFAWPFFPMHLRGAERTLVDTMHLVLSGVTVLLLVLAIGSGAGAFGRRFRIYSIGTIAVMLLFGMLTGLDAPRVDAGLPTPYLGITERLSLGAYLLWIASMSVALLRLRSGSPTARRWIASAGG